MKQVLLTGGTGFVGRQILARLLERNCEVRLAVRKPHDILATVEQVVVEDLFMASQDELERLCKGIDLVIHAAWYAVPGKYLTADENLICLSGTLEFAKAAQRSGVSRFVGVGTCFEYDLAEGYLRTNTKLSPATLYGACKAAAFLSLVQLMRCGGQSFAWCRLFYLFGHGEDERRLVPYIRTQLAAGKTAELTSGKQIRDYINVVEAGRQIADVSLGDLEGPLNICSGTPVTVADLARSIADEYGRRDLLAFGAREETLGDPLCVFGEPSLTYHPKVDE